MDQQQKEFLKQMYIEYIKEDVLPRAQSRLLDRIKECRPEMHEEAVAYMRTVEWSHGTRFAYESYVNNQDNRLWAKVEQLVSIKTKAITVLTAISTVMSLICLASLIYMCL